MLSIFIMLVIAIGISAGIGYSILTLIKSGETSLGIQKNQVQVENVAGAIRANLRYRNGVVVMPIRDPTITGGSSLSLVPDVSPFIQTAYGMDIVYCPVSVTDVNDGSVAGDLEAVIESGGGAYDVRVAELDPGRFYVTAGAPTAVAHDILGDPVSYLKNAGVVAYLVSPAPQADPDKLPGCADIEFAMEVPKEEPQEEGRPVTLDHRIIVRDGQFTPIYASSPRMSGMKFVLASDDDALPGEIAIQDIGGIADYIGNFGVVDATVRIPSDVEVDSTDLKRLAKGSFGRNLRIVGDADGQPVVTVNGTDAVIEFEGDASIEDISFVGDVSDVEFVSPPLSRLFLTNAATDRLRVNGGRAFLSSGSFIQPRSGISDPPVQVTHGELVVGDDVAVPVVDAPSASAAFRIEGGTMTFRGIPEVAVSSEGEAVEISGNGRVTGSAVMVVRGEVAPVSETVFPERFETAEEICPDGSGECVAACPVGRTVVPGTGGCSSADGHALAGFGISEDGNSYACRWSTPMAGHYPAEPKAVAMCR